MPPPPPPPRRDPRATAASKEENAYIPQFISKKPFYIGEEDSTSTSTDYLEHQRLQKKEEKSSWYDRGKKAGPAATKWRKGACENCGAMGHKRKDCLEKPRKIGAKWSGRDIKADDIIQEVNLGWDAKRDRWNGFDAREYRSVVEDYNQMEEMRRQMQAKKAADEDEEKEGDGDHYAEEVDMGKHQPTSTRQLRIREDTAKYLLNLDLESAKYDPKTRTIVDAGATNDKAAELFAQQGFLKASGEAAEFEKAQKYAWETQEKTGDTSQHLQANPTAGQFYRKKEKEEAEKARLQREKELEERYGTGVTSAEMPKALRDMTVTESERFVEYDDVGLIKGAPKTVARSKYPEDVYPNNHTSVFGSWWSDFKWGYACCHSFVKNSYCTGEEGKKLWAEAERQRTGANLEDQEDGAEEDRAEKDASEEKDAEKDAAKPEKVAKKRTAEEMMGDVTEAELEEYRRKRTAADDPMAKFLGKDELVN